MVEERVTHDPFRAKEDANKNGSKISRGKLWRVVAFYPRYRTPDAEQVLYLTDLFVSLSLIANKKDEYSCKKYSVLGSGSGKDGRAEEPQNNH